MKTINDLKAEFRKRYPLEKAKEIERQKGRYNLGNPASKAEADKVEEILAYYGAKLSLETRIRRIEESTMKM